MLQHLAPLGYSAFATEALRTIDQCLHLGNGVIYCLINLNSMAFVH